MIDVFFDNIHSQIIKQISEAKNGIKICVAWFTDVDIYHSILIAQKRGVNVSIIIANHELNKNSRIDFKELLQNNGYVGYIGNVHDGVEDKLMHNKFCIIDEQTIITGSYNWTYKARMNDENIIIIENQPEIIEKFNNKFESIKPQYGFAVQENKVELLPIESIIAKWDNQPNSPVQKVLAKSNVDIISAKF
jgi:phosphatidylserine/phosphatidylglycerophosphate/cardiolipin synthase-like enzyme